MSNPAQLRLSVELVRFVAAFGVVVAHAQASPRDWVGHLSLGIFLILTAFLAMQSMQRAGGRYKLLPRMRRILLPWLFWCLFFRLVAYALAGRALPVLSDPWSLLYGPTIHLWFLPFVALAMICVAPVGRLVTDDRTLAIALGLWLAFTALAFALHETSLPEPLAQWTFAAPLYLYGLLLAPAHRLNRAGWLVAAAALVSCAGGLMTLAPWPWAVLIAALIFEAAWRLDLHHPILPALGAVAFGIYLMHPFFMLAVWKLLGPDTARLPAAIAAFALSWAATEAARRLPGFRLVV